MNFVLDGDAASDQLNILVIETDLSTFSVLNSDIGPGLSTRAYSFDTRYSIGTGSVVVNDAGATAVMHATGTTSDGVGVDVVVNCPNVTRV